MVDTTYHITSGYTTTTTFEYNKYILSRSLLQHHQQTHEKNNNQYSKLNGLNIFSDIRWREQVTF